MNGRVVVTGSSVAERFLVPLSDAGLEIDMAPGDMDEAALSERLEGASAYLLGGDEFVSADALARADELKVIAFLGVGYESFVDASAAAEKGIPVTNTPGTLTQSVAEFTLGLTLNATRLLSVYIGRGFSPDAPAEEKQHDLASLRVGIVGLGAIGTRLAEMLVQGIGSEVSYFSRTRKSDEETRLGIKYLELADLASQSDVLIVMTPGNDETEGLLGKDVLGSLPDGSILVNTARPAIVDSLALSEALDAGRVSVAVFDDFYSAEDVNYEALADFYPDRLQVTRHIGSLTHEARDGMAIKCVNSILNVLKSGTDEYIVNGVRQF